MKDFNGVEIKVGDIIITTTTPRGRRGLIESKVLKINKVMVETNHGLKYGYNVVVIKRIKK